MIGSKLMYTGSYLWQHSSVNGPICLPRKKRNHATSGDIRIHEVTPSEKCGGSEKAYTALVALIHRTYQKLTRPWEMFPMSHPPQAAIRQILFAYLLAGSWIDCLLV